MCTVTRLVAAAERLAMCEGNLGRAHAEDRVADRVTLRLVEAALANERSRFNGLTDIFEAFVGALKTLNGGTDDQQADAWVLVEQVADDRSREHHRIADAMEQYCGYRDGPRYGAKTY